jgi:2-keto-4-pentenoate hydratase/2-oxohepta-3-ene-1,7-dioic acid hydratase in catechol pathway
MLDNLNSMKFLRFKSKDGESRFGLLEENTVLEIEGDIFGEYKITQNQYSLSEIKFLPPYSPSKIVAVGLNYRDHAEEMKKPLPEEPLLFMKPSTAVVAHEDKIIYPTHMSSRVDYEGELAVVIGKKARWVKESEALNYVFGYTCINDVTARDLQVKDVQYTRAKGFDTFAPIGPVIETELDPSDLEISTFLNGERKQHSRTSSLIFSVPRLISFISHVMTLLPGDIIATGTPSGIGSMKSGDKVEVEIEGIGVLRNYVE